MNRMLAFFLLAGSLLAQQDTRLYEAKNLSGSRILAVCGLVNHLISPPFPGASVQPAPELKAVVIQGTPAAIAKAEEYLKRFDVPEPPPTPQANPVLTIYLVRASAKPPEHPHPLPPELDSVIAEMKRSFTYENYSLFDTVVLPARTQDIESMIPYASFNGTPYFYKITRKSGWGVQADGKTVDIPGLTFTVQVPYHSGNEMKAGTASIATGVRIQEGQKVVLGKVKIDPQDNTDVFLVLTMKLQ